LIQARDDLERIVATQTALWRSAGCPPTFSVDGESYDWNNWLSSKTAALAELQKLIQQRSGSAFIVRSRQRA